MLITVNYRKMGLFDHIFRLILQSDQSWRFKAEIYWEFMMANRDYSGVTSLAKQSSS